MVEQPKNPNLDGLTELASRDGVDIKPTLLRVMTDLYVQKPAHSAEEERQYIELASRLVDQVDAATRSLVADRLANYPAAPAEIVRRLGLGSSPAILITAPERPAEQPAPPPQPVAGPAATLAELSELFFAADAQERRMILLHLDYSTLPPAAPIAPQLAQDVIRRLEMAALGHNSESFAQEAERSFGIARSLAHRLIDDESGEPILVMAMALGMPAEVLQRILLCLNPVISQSVLRVYELSMLYEEIEQQAALRMIAVWQAHQPAAQRPAPHQPQYWHDDTKEPAIPARPAIRWDEHGRRREAEG